MNSAMSPLDHLTFIVRLQRLANPAAAAGQQHRSFDSQGKVLRLLVVDDNQDAADMLVMFLQLVGHQVDNCNSSTDALQVIDRDSYDAVLLDIGLPGMNGYELARQIRQDKGLATPLLIAISGYGQDKDREAANAAGIDHYMVKPVDTGELLKLLQQIAH